MRQTVQGAFDDHIKAQAIREAVAYVKAMSDLHGDQMMEWADEEVRNAALKYADVLEARAIGDITSLDPEGDSDV